MTDDEPTARERLLDELVRERYAPALPKPGTRRTRKTRQAPTADPAPKRDTGTGWPA